MATVNKQENGWNALSQLENLGCNEHSLNITGDKKIIECFHLNEVYQVSLLGGLKREAL